MQRCTVFARVAKEHDGRHWEQAIELACERGQQGARPCASFEVDHQKDKTLDLVRLHAAGFGQQAELPCSQGVQFVIGELQKERRTGPVRQSGVDGVELLAAAQKVF